MICKNNFISLSQLRLFKSFKNSRKLSKGYKFRKMKRIVGNISGVPTNTHLSNLQAPLQKHQTSFALRMWKSRCCNKLRTFSWLLLMDRLNTRKLLRRRNFNIVDNNYNCALCNDNVEETAFHLFFSCTFSRSCWQTIGLEWRRDLNFFQTMKRTQQEFHHWFFMDIFI